MKFILVLVVLLGAVWLWRRNRAEDAREEAREEALEAARKRAQPPTQSPPAVQAPAEMVSCGHCGLHLPASDAVVGARGHYCCTDHLQQHEA